MNEYQRSCKLMGTSFSLGVLAAQEAIAQEWLQNGVDEIKRIELLLTEFSSESTTGKINALAAKEKLKIDKETFDLIQRCLSISKLSKGAFDITMGPLKKIYKFGNSDFFMPTYNQINSELKKVGYQKINLDIAKQSIAFDCQDMSISFAAIGKGYASDMVKDLWLAHGVTSGFINASGDLNVFGKKANGQAWKVGISNPDSPKETLMYVPLDNGSVATSGDYEQYFTWKGKRYSHNINPLTGKPVCGIKSVTVFSPKAELSDALATAVYAKGTEAGIDFINQLPSTHCVIIEESNQIHLSKNMIYEATGY